MFRRVLVDSLKNGTAELVVSGVLLSSAAIYFSNVITSSSSINDIDERITSLDPTSQPLSAKRRLEIFLGLSPPVPPPSSSPRPPPPPLLPFVPSVAVSLPSLRQCVVMRIPQSGIGFDGPAALKGLSVGDEVDVVEEGVGPGGMYHLCRRGKEVGWYPTWFLESKEKGREGRVEDSGHGFKGGRGQGQ